jgi:hypothetical protein
MNRRGPALSVLMPARNAAPFLAAAVDSILGQTYGDFELIVVDDGSTDATAALLADYAGLDRRVRMLAGPPVGVSAALNRAAAAAAAPILVRMDADDVSLPGRFRCQRDYLDRHPEVGVVGSAFAVIDAGGRRLLGRRPPTDDAAIRRHLLAGESVVAHPSVAMRADLFKRAGGYRSTFPAAQDLDLWLRLLPNTRFANLPDELLLYRLHPGTVSLCRMEEQALAAVAARLCHRARTAGRPDPLGDDLPPSRAVLLANGLDAADLDRMVVGRAFAAALSAELAGSAEGARAALAALAAAAGRPRPTPSALLAFLARLARLACRGGSRPSTIVRLAISALRLSCRE